MTRRVTLAIAAAITALLLSAGLAAAQDPPETATATRLEPGLNLVGWVGEPTPVSQLFQQIPRLEAIWAWDAELRDWIVAAPGAPEWLGGLGRVTAGMGLRMQLGGDQPYLWQRSTEPTRGLVRLRTGWNLVAWSGADGASIGDVAKGIGWSLRTVRRWDAANQQWVAWTSPERSAHVIANTGADQGADDNAEMPGIRRGEALWIEVARAVNWLQPTEILPRLVFPGGASQELQTRVREDLEAVLAFYRDQYGIQADPDFTVYAAKDVDALIQAYKDDGREVDDAYEASQREQWRRLAGWASADRFVVKQSEWPDDLSTDEITWARYLVTHEYFHIVQFQLSPSTHPEWLIEGTADWAEDQHKVLDGGETWGNLRDSVSSAINNDTPTLRSTEASNARWEYRLGWLATDHLTADAGADSWIEFWRQPISTEIGSLGWRELTYDWRAAFQSVFGRPVLEFYEVFDAWQREQAAANPATANSYDGNWIRGRVADEDDSPVAGVFVNAIRVEGETDVGWNQRAETGADGSFSVRAPKDGDYRLSVDINDDCARYYSDGELINDEAEAQPIAVAGRDVRGIDVQLPANLCGWQIQGRAVGQLSGRLTDSNSAPLSGISVSICQLGEITGNVDCVTPLLDRNTNEDGSFSIAVPRTGTYRLSVNLHGCSVYYQPGGLTPAITEAVPISVAEASNPDLQIRVPAGMCAYRIKGSITQADGRPLAGTRVVACGVRPGFCWPWAAGETDDDGVFTVTVPSEGRYWLSFEAYLFGTYSSCEIHFSPDGLTTTRSERRSVRVEGRNARPSHRQIPRGMCAPQIEGSIAKADGQPLANTDIHACIVVGGSCTRTEGATTDDDGSFTIAGPTEGRYRVSFSLNGCTIYFSSDGLTTTLSEHFAVYVKSSDVSLGQRQIPRGMCAPQIKGGIAQANGQPLANTHISGCLVVDGNCAETVGGRTDGAGAFVITAATGGEYRLNFDIDGCTIYFSSDGLTATRSERSTVRVEGRDLRLGHRQIPNGVCQHRITGRAVDSDGAPLAGKLMIVRGPLGSAAAQTDLPASTDAGGSFDILVPSDGAYSFGVQLREQPYCWYNFGGQTLGSPNNPVRVDGADAAGVVLRPPAAIEELCE